MERIKLIVLAIFIMCSTIFVSSFFYLPAISKDDVYEHMNEQFQDIFQAVNVSLESDIITQEEFDQSISSDVLKERIQNLFDTVETNSFYTYDEETIAEVFSNVEIIYEKELKRIDQEDANNAVSLIRILSGSACLLVCGIFYILYKKKKVVKKKVKETTSKPKETPVENKENDEKKELKTDIVNEVKVDTSKKEHIMTENDDKS